MKSLSEMIFPEELLYTRAHIWVRRSGEVWEAGITDYAQDQLGEVVFVDLAGIGETIDEDAEFGTVESIKSVSPLHMPVAGTIIERNTALDTTPTLINIDCYGKAWMIRFKPNSDDASGLLTASYYKDAIK